MSNKATKLFQFKCYGIDWVSSGGCRRGKSALSFRHAPRATSLSEGGYAFGNLATSLSGGETPPLQYGDQQSPTSPITYSLLPITSKKLRPQGAI